MIRKIKAKTSLYAGADYILSSIFHYFAKFDKTGRNLLVINSGL